MSAPVQKTRNFDKGNGQFFVWRYVAKTHPVWKPVPLFLRGEPPDLLGIALLLPHIEQPRRTYAPTCLGGEWECQQEVVIRAQNAAACTA